MATQALSDPQTSGPGPATPSVESAAMPSPGPETSGADRLRPSLKPCSCGFEGWELGWYSLAWKREHEKYHLDNFPDSDRQTRDALRMAVEIAERREEAGA